MARFRSTRAAIVRIVGGRVQAAEARGLAGTITLTGRNTSTQRCGVTETPTPQACSQTIRKFGDARVAVVGTAPGSVALRALQVQLPRSECPREPDDVARLPLGVVPTPLRISPALLERERTTRITLRASASQRTNYAAPELGSSTQRSAWTLTFTRFHR